MKSLPKILVVDDEKTICQNVAKILEKNDYEVIQANGADEALEKLALDSFSLLISDIVMPNKNGLELLKVAKKEWPLTKAVMMTVFASVDTAVKAIRLGALDYIPKPFTPEELRSTVEKALSGKLTPVEISSNEAEIIDVIDIDVPFDSDEVSKATGDDYAKMLGRSDMPVVEVKMPEKIENYCEVGEMVCDIFKKLGATCKAGIKTAACPQKKAKKTKGSAKKKAADPKKLIGIDMPFDYKEVASVTGPEYVRNLHEEGVVFVPYEELKKNMESRTGKKEIDVDMPFDRQEVAAATGEQYVDQVSRSDVPVVEIRADQPIENFCEVGDMVCDIFKKLGATCKAGVKTAACPQKKAKKGKAAAKKTGFDAAKLIGIDHPFDYKSVEAVTGPEYIRHLAYDGVAQIPYEELKANVSQMLAEKPKAEIVTLSDNLVSSQILVIDDEVAVNNNIRKILGKKGYAVDQAVSKDEAVERIQARSYTLILLDLKMPGVKGLELLETIRDQQPDAKVIMITGYASIETAVEAARMGAVDYIPKPFTPAEIRHATDRAFQLAA